MTELELYRYIHDEDGEKPEISWRGDSLMVWIHPAWYDDFIKLLLNESSSPWSSLFDDGGLVANIQNSGYLAVDLVPICEYFDINPENILGKD